MALRPAPLLERCRCRSERRERRRELPRVCPPSPSPPAPSPSRADSMRNAACRPEQSADISMAVTRVGHIHMVRLCRNGGSMRDADKHTAASEEQCHAGSSSYSCLQALVTATRAAGKHNC